MDYMNYDGWLKDAVKTKKLILDTCGSDPNLYQNYEESLIDECYRLREEEYPSVIEFIDAYYWSCRGDTSLMDKYMNKCDTIKDKYPKPSLS